MGSCSSSNKTNIRPHKISTIKDNTLKVILECKLTRDNIKNYIKRLEKNEALSKTKAKEALRNNNRERAKIYLSQSKLYREHIKSANGQLNMIEDQVIQIESANQHKDAIKVLENGNKVLKQLYEEVNVDRWEKIADDMNEIKLQQDEIGNFLKNHGIQQAEYDSAVDQELEILMKQESKELHQQLPDVNKVNPKEERLDIDNNKKEIQRVAISY